MKYIITIFTIFALSANIFAQTAENKIEGFRTLKWGDEISNIMINGEVANFIETEKAKEGTFYILPSDNLMIGNVLLDEIKYVFSKKDDKFFKVSLTGKKEDVEQMKFIVNHKYGEHINETEKDDKIMRQWIVNNVTITLKDFTFNKFELLIESDWEAAEAYKKNTNVTDF
ncbi:MAG: hypothetical protein ACPG4Y_01445 [Chitinophagales bacterium]